MQSTLSHRSANRHRIVNDLANDITSDIESDIANDIESESQSSRYCLATRKALRLATSSSSSSLRRGLRRGGFGSKTIAISTAGAAGISRCNNGRLAGRRLEGGGPVRPAHALRLQRRRVGKGTHQALPGLESRSTRTGGTDSNRNNANFALFYSTNALRDRQLPRKATPTTAHAC
jgi:hypothetical protein